MRRTASIVVAIVVLTAVVSAYFTYREHEKQSHAVDLILGTPDKEGLIKKNKSLAPVVAAQFHDYKTNSILWSTAHHTALFGSALLGVLATLILKLETPAWSDKVRKDLAAVLASLSALMITVSTSGDFQHKWQATRMAAADTAAQAFELLKLEDNVPLQVVTDIEAILMRQNEAIVSESKPVPVPKKPTPPSNNETSVSEGGSVPAAKKPPAPPNADGKKEK